jgi:beta-galactosidase/beta-glucuronidase
LAFFDSCCHLNLVKSICLLAAVAILATGASTRSNQASVPAQTEARQVISIDGNWLFQTNGAPAGKWKNVQVPSTFQSHEGTNFHGIGWYRREVTPFQLKAGHRVLLQFNAAATEAEVWWNGQKLGSHLGGWTPFRFDITPWFQAPGKGATNELLVRLDEKVGHNTQGFLPIIEPHFGGLWQSVELLVVPEMHVQDLALQAAGNPQTGMIELDIPVAGGAAEKCDEILVRHRLRGEQEWMNVRAVRGNRGWNASANQESHSTAALEGEGSILRIRMPVSKPMNWSPAEPNLYEIEIQLPANSDGTPGDIVRTRAAFRRIEGFGTQLRLNGNPLNVRGLLNWGYYPPTLEPNPSEELFRADIAMAQSYGFNMMKFCLWVPPKRLLELADEMGILTWMEYPTWHPQLTGKHLEALQKEFSEFFAYDRNHPSVILRSLTCETGPGADLKVIQSLYDMAHSMVPGAMVVDDSSWIQWNRICDFYDDHPYGNNHTWVPTLRRLNDYILGHGPKPLVLGEAMAADTWAPRSPLEAFSQDPRPYWFPLSFDDQERWLGIMSSSAGPAALDRLVPDSLRYGMLMRKYQAETFRREIPHGGYVITVIRDINHASMGLLDYFGNRKWSEADWSWQRDTICILKTPDDARGFEAATQFRGELLVSHFGVQAIRDGELTVRLARPGEAAGPSHAPSAQMEVLHQSKIQGLSRNPGTLAKVLDLNFPLPDTSRPEQLVFSAKLKTHQGEFENQWPIWIVPKLSATKATPIRLHSSVPEDVAAELFPKAEYLTQADSGAVVVASAFDEQLVELLEKGGRVLLLPNGESNSLPLRAHWFLQGAPCISEHHVTTVAPRDMLLELQHFDLASEVVPDLQYLEQVDPILVLWDTHGWDRVKTHGLIYETRAGKGRLMVSAVRHRGPANPAGKWLLEVLLAELASNRQPKRALSDPLWTRLKEKLSERKISLVDRAWKFRPDPEALGLEQGWNATTLEEGADWKEIRVGRSWESQGYPALDGWAWYRLSLVVPSDWPKVFLTFEGVDDMYELYINGKLAGKRGDAATRETSFHEKLSWDLTQFVKPGQPCVIAVRVYDWYGAGGIFRPVTLATVPLRPELEILK